MSLLFISYINIYLVTMCSHIESCMFSSGLFVPSKVSCSVIIAVCHNMIALHCSKKPLLLPLPLVSLIWEQQWANGRWWSFKIKQAKKTSHAAHWLWKDSTTTVWCILAAKHIPLHASKTIMAAESPSLSHSSLVGFLFTEPKEVSMYMMCFGGHGTLVVPVCKSGICIQLFWYSTHCLRFTSG